jgi:beta-glucanase (GH16 family)
MKTRWRVDTSRVRNAFLAAILVLALAACAGASQVTPGALALDDSLLVERAGAPKMLLDDEFAGSSLNTKLWYTCYNWAAPGQGCSNNGGLELEWYEPGNVAIEGGYANLVARRQTREKGFPYTSGLIETGGTPTTKATFAFLYGYAEIRARLPRGTGMWPAFWLLQTNNAWPPEIDIMEWQGVAPKGDVVTIHWKDAAGNHQQNSSVYLAAAPLWRSYHTYGVDWEPDAVTWYLDGVAIKRFAQREWIPKLPMYVILNLAIGGWEPHQLHPSPNSFPATFSIDYVRVWNKRPQQQ